MTEFVSNLSIKKLFLMDSLGALLSAFMLGIVLVYFQPAIGLPKSILYLLAAIAFLFFMYSMACFMLKPSNWRGYLRVIAVANLLYCILTLSLCFFHCTSLTVLTWLYFSGEVLVVISLSLLELRKAK